MFNAFPKIKIVDQSNMIAFADSKNNVTWKQFKFYLGRVENIVGKG